MRFSYYIRVYSILRLVTLCDITFSVWQAIAEDPGGGAALQQDEQLIDSMLSLLQGPAILTLTGRAAALMAELSAEAIYRPFAQVSCILLSAKSKGRECVPF